MIINYLIFLCLILFLHLTLMIIVSIGLFIALIKTIHKLDKKQEYTSANCTEPKKLDFLILLY